jgi:hypothetical protein
LNAGLMDAIENFDGSIESLTQIGLIVTSIREGELKLLSQIDAIQKGITVSLEKLKADILGLTEIPKTGEQIFTEAAALRGQIGAAETPEEIARLTQEFEALIRSISPEEQALNQGAILGLIESFQAAADLRLDEQRQNVIDAAEATRQMVDQFIERIGTPLETLAASNPTVVDHLAAIEKNTAPDDSDDLGERVATAIVEGFSGADFNVPVTVVINGGGLVNE